jgi:hypothetical protein
MGMRRAIARSVRVYRRRRRGTGKATAPAGVGNKGGDYRHNFWYRVSSSWIKALRFVPTGATGATGQVLGYVDMWVLWKGRKYRYGERGPGIYHHRFGDWIEAASKGKHWWYKWTLEYSPARRIG